MEGEGGAERLQRGVGVEREAEREKLRDAVTKTESLREKEGEGERSSLVSS